MVDRIKPEQLKAIVDGALLAAGEPLSVARLVKLFKLGELDPQEGRNQIREVLKELEQEAEGRGYRLRRVASGYRYQVRQEISLWVSRLWDEKPPRYSRALLETLALVAYKQPVTRGDIEQIRGVSVSPNIMRTLLERGWVKVVGQREVPGRPSLYGTTRAFLDYFDLKNLDELPPLAEIRELIEPLVVDADGAEPEAAAAPTSEAASESGTEESSDAAPAEIPIPTVQLPPEAEPEESETQAEVAAEPQTTAEVVHLPTSGGGSR